MKNILVLWVLCVLVLGTDWLPAQERKGSSAALTTEKSVQVDLEALNQMTGEELLAYLAALEDAELIATVKIILESNYAALSTRVLEALRQIINAKDAVEAKAFLEKMQTAIPELSVYYDSAQGLVLSLFAPPSFISRSVFSSTPEISKASSIK